MLNLKLDGEVFVAADEEIPGLLVVSKDVLALVNGLVPEAIAELADAKLAAEISSQ